MSWDERADRFEKKPVATGVRWAFIALGLGVVAAIIFGVLGFAGAWTSKSASIVSPANVEKQYGVVIKNWEALTAAADTACQVAAPQPASSDQPLIVESPSLAYASVYRNIWVKYNAAQANVFDAGLVGPPGYPKEIPRYKEASGPSPDFCAISDKLAALKAAQ
ncbi:hypothetical protein F1C58_16180 (plasmid) [Glaciihabitans sp. INWT7]|uniref:hypothetical protein n=1 Tax=Glaciihabitans sp. INWT7 TaxID=2596912 RepID=UPI0016257603|nr:hypothetical protein [Glaciihabitans sp. INWT7]QNE48597.1 hypothetical protein F1C58_16180 [Glaciihabitans sp. INWT7]